MIQCKLLGVKQPKFESKYARYNQGPHKQSTQTTTINLNQIFKSKDDKKMDKLAQQRPIVCDHHTKIAVANRPHRLTQCEFITTTLMHDDDLKCVDICNLNTVYTQ